VSIVDRVIDAASGTFGVRLTMPNPGHAVPAGLKCMVEFPGQAKAEAAF
jgi:multidrug efflux pump subunit AcrA (membrane-fusion protein)